MLCKSIKLNRVKIYFEFKTIFVIKPKNFKTGVATKVLTHGFRDSGNATWILDMKDTYLRNVIKTIINNKQISIIKTQAKQFVFQLIFIFLSMK